LISSVLIFAQNNSSTFKKKFELLLSFNKLPINQKTASVGFLYADGLIPSTIPIDTISANYTIQNQKFNTAIGIGLSYRFSKSFTFSCQAKPHVNSFLSNKSKNAKVYGVQLDLVGSYEKKMTEKFYASGGLALSRIIGGYGITSGGAAKKDYLLVNKEEYYDKDIGFHIIDKAFAAILQLGLKYDLSPRIRIFTNLGCQYSFARTSKMNFAGLLKDGNVKWNTKKYDDKDLFLNINGQRVTDNGIEKLPFLFSGLALELGILVPFRSVPSGK
jgi:hypothetical protein